MLATFEQLKLNFKLKPQVYSIDNLVFRMHYRITTLILFVSTVLVTSRQYIGEHIKCISDEGVPQHVMNTYCFFTSTFTVVKHMNETLLNMGGLAHPGVGPLGLNTNEEIKHHSYYQWVPFLLFGQAIMFYIPHMIWKKIEGGRLRRLVEGLQFAAFSLEDKEIDVRDTKIPSKESRDEKLRQINQAFMGRLYINRTWSRALVCCEILNAVNICLQVYLTNRFLDGQFLTLGQEIIKNGLESSVDILDVIFPKVTKCTFHKYGPSGTIQAHDAMCIMALNIINEKIYTFLWFWYVVLMVVTVTGIAWRALTILLHAKSQLFNEIVFSNACPGKLNPWRVLKVTRYCNFTDWLFLYYLSKNMDGFVFRELFINLAEELDRENPPLLEVSDSGSGSYSTYKKE